MKQTVTYRFNKFKDRSIGAIVTLSKAVRGMKYGKRIVSDAFNKFVPKGEFAQDERDEILEDLYTKNSSDETPEITLINKDSRKE